MTVMLGSRMSVAQGVPTLRWLALIVLLALPAATPLGRTAPPARAVTASGSALAVELGTVTVSAELGQRFTFVSTIRNTGAAASTPAVAHLDVLSLDPDVYVDPEDWSADRTQYLDPTPAGSSTPVSWTVRAVNSGRLLIYVTVVEPELRDAVAVSAPLRLTVAPRDRLAGPGALPLAVGVPAVLLALALATGRRRRSLSRAGPASDTTTG